MVNTAEADVISPTVAAEDPNRLLREVFLMSQNVLAECAICAGFFNGVCQCLRSVCILSAVFKRCKVSVCRRLNVCACFVRLSDLLNFAYKTVADSFLTEVHTVAVLCVILKQRVSPCRTVALGVCGVRRGSGRTAPNGRAAGSV